MCYVDGDCMFVVKFHLRNRMDIARFHETKGIYLID